MELGCLHAPGRGGWFVFVQGNDEEENGQRDQNGGRQNRRKQEYGHVAETQRYITYAREFWLCETHKLSVFCWIPEQLKFTISCTDQYFF